MSIDPTRTPSLGVVRAYWDKKERISIKCNKRTIQDARISSHNEPDHSIRQHGRRDEHRGPEYIWYWTWNIIINRTLDGYEFLSLAPQSRITRVLFDDDGTKSTKSRIPDLGIMRHTDDHIVEKDGELVWEEAFSRLVAIGEIKPAPIDESALIVRAAVLEARNDLLVQVGIFFEADSEVEAVIGISVAGDWWTFETFTRTEYQTHYKTKDDNADYIPSSDMDTDGSTIPSSDRDELDVISQDEHLEHFPDVDQDQDGFQLPLFHLLTMHSELGLALLVSALRQLPGCEAFQDFPF